MQKKGYPPLVIYGVPFHNITFAEAVDWIMERVRSGQPAQVVTANLDFITQAWSNPELHRILIDADLVLADGFPIVKLSPFFGPRLKMRVTGSDLIPRLAACAAEQKLRIYSLGGAPGVAEKAIHILTARHPSLPEAGIDAPPPAPLEQMDHQKIVQRIKQANPDLLFVALGAPKQEKFIHMHLAEWRVPVSIGIGASLDFIAGKQWRAPKKIQNLNLEWLWRLCCNPRRLLRRYTTNLCFLIRTTCQMVKIHKTPDRPVHFHPLEKADIKWLKNQGVTLLNLQTQEPDATQGHLLIDLHTLPWIDSQQLGLLLEINKHCRAQEKQLILYAPRLKVMRLLETCHLNTYFTIATQMKAVKTLILAPNTTTPN